MHQNWTFAKISLISIYATLCSCRVKYEINHIICTVFLMMYHYNASVVLNKNKSHRYNFRSENKDNQHWDQEWVNLRQHALDHDTNTINKSCKEANINKQTATRKDCEMVESSLVQTEVSQNDKSLSK